MPIIIVAILIPSLMYAYAYVAVEDAYSKSWDTISLPEVDETMLEGTEITDEITIRNPTGTSIRLFRVNMDSWINGNEFATMRETDIYLPAGGSATLHCTFYFSSQIMNSILSPTYVLAIRLETAVSANVLFMPITRTFVRENTETKYHS